MGDTIDILQSLRHEREQHVRFRKVAADISEAHPNTELGRVMAEHCKKLDAAIESLDLALRVSV